METAAGRTASPTLSPGRDAAHDSPDPAGVTKISNRLEKHAVRLDLAEDALVHENLSGAAFVGEFLWVASDEACGVERLERLAPVGDESLRFGAPTNFPLADLLDLPGEADAEADLEGLAVHDGYLWVVGSHGLKRKNAKTGRDNASNAKQLTQLKLDANRRLLARLPLDEDDAGRPTLSRQTADGRRAARLRGDATANELTRLLADDPHFGAFLSIPGKDNGFDIEGLAVFGNRLLLGLRGPVLRGWAGMLEIAVEADGRDLTLAPLDNRGTKLRKHFLDLDGLGVRDLHVDGTDLYVLAGPTMALDGEVRLYRWPNGLDRVTENVDPAAFWTSLETSCVLPHGDGCDRAEAFCALPAALAGGQRGWLALYDAPSPDRHVARYSVFGDIVRRD
jgi:hypothetical protein